MRSSQRSSTCCTRTSGSGAARGRSSSGSCRSGSSITPPTRPGSPLLHVVSWSAATGRRTSRSRPRRVVRGHDSRAGRFRLSRGRPQHRHLRRPPGAGRAATPRTISSPAASIGPVVFLLSLFGTNMTAFSILGASGHAFANGIVTYGLMASSSALVIPLGIFLIGTRLWALGKRHGFMTPVQMFRDRWECGHIGTVIFAVQAVLLIPYIVIAVMGGGTTLQRGQQRAGALLARRRGRVAGGHGLRVLRRHARHRLGQHVPDGPVPVVRRHRGRGDRARHGRIRRTRWSRCSRRRPRRRCSPASASRRSTFSATPSSRSRRSPSRTSASSA